MLKHTLLGTVLLSLSMVHLAAIPQAQHEGRTPNASAAGAATPAASPQDTLRRARAAYYSLRRSGLVSFQSNVTPTWEVALRELTRTDPSRAARTLPLVNTLTFAWSVSASDAVTVTHGPAPAEGNAAAFTQIFNGMEQALKGFYDTWSMYMMTPPFPSAETAVTLDEVGGQYRLRYKEGTSDIVTTMTKEFAVTEVVVTAPDFHSSVKPHFTTTPDGFVLNAYEGDYVPPSGQGVVNLQTQISYQTVNGFRLPATVRANATVDGVPNATELVFSGYQLSTK